LRVTHRRLWPLEHKRITRVIASIAWRSKPSKLRDYIFYNGASLKLTIINIANKMPSWVVSACDEYLKRINHGKYSCKIVEIKADKLAAKSPLENMSQEAKKIRSHIPEGSFVIALDEKGQNLDSIKFAKRLEDIALHNSSITFIIGGADGLHPDLKKEVNLQIQLSSLTFPHALVRVIILEQLYRAITILDNHPYHRE
jgi:23S rRNA (pseudouridine1915-N3)-methyltransferase